MEIRRIGMSAIGVPANNIYHCIDRMKDPSQFSHREGIEDKHSRQLWRVFLGGCCLIFPASGRTPNIIVAQRKVRIQIHLRRPQFLPSTHSSLASLGTYQGVPR